MIFCEFAIDGGSHLVKLNVKQQRTVRCCELIPGGDKNGQEEKDDEESYEEKSYEKSRSQKEVVEAN